MGATPPVPAIGIGSAVVVFLMQLGSVRLFAELTVPTRTVMPGDGDVVPPGATLKVSFGGTLVLPVARGGVTRGTTVQVAYKLIVFIESVTPIASRWMIAKKPPADPTGGRTEPSPGGMQYEPKSFAGSFPTAILAACASPVYSVAKTVTAKVVGDANSRRGLKGAG